MNNQIPVTFDVKTQRLVMAVPFFLADVARGFPSRRFDPKSKTWRMPLVAANIRHLNESRHMYDFKLDEGADAAVRDHAKLTAAPKVIPFPSHIYDFKKCEKAFVPMNHQNKMLDLSWNLPASAWFAKMGTGKTYAAIHLACARFKAGEIDGLMILCPATLRATWRKELKKFATLPYDYRIHETRMPGLQQFYSGPHDGKLPILGVSIEGFGVSEALYDSACGFLVNRRVMVVCDESSRIKNPTAKRTQRAITLGNAASYRMILNGTPIALGIQDLWAQYEFLDPNIIGCGDYWAFKTRYLQMGGYEQKQIVGYKHLDELMNLIIPYTIEVGKDVLDLPPKVPKSLYCTSTVEQRELFKLVIKGASSDPNAPLIKVENVLEKMLRLRQIVGGYLPRGKIITKVIDGIECDVIETTIERLKENPKMDMFFDMIEDHRIGSKFIIWATFVHEIEDIRDRLVEKYGPESVECYYGRTAPGQRPIIEDRYCTDPKLRFFIGNPTAAGLGLTLISGENDVMVYYSGTNAYIDRAQSEDRAHRIGQKNSVVVLDLIMEKSVDELIQASIEAKMDIEKYVMERVGQGVKLDDLLLSLSEGP